MATIATAGFGDSSVLTAEQVLPYWDEDFYLAQYPDVQEAIASGNFNSGLDHFLQVGVDEGRDPGFEPPPQPENDLADANLLAPRAAALSLARLPNTIPGSLRLLRAGSESTSAFVPPPRLPLPSQNENLGQTSNPPFDNSITVNYSGFTPEAQAAFQYAVNIWNSLISSPINIEIDASFTNLGAGILGGAGPNALFSNFLNAPQDNTFYPVALANQYAASDLNGGNAEIIAQFNNTGVNWYFGTDGNPGVSQFDFVTVVLHEIAHGLGFSDSFYVSGGQGSWGLSTPPVPTIFDRFVQNGSGQTLITAFTNPSAPLGSQITGGDLFFSGANAGNANGGARPELYAPNPYEPGSSVAHLDEVVFPTGTTNALMTPFLAPREALHNPGPITLGIFQDIGWTLQAGTPDLSITKTDTPDPVSAGGLLTYQLTLNNTGAADAIGVAVRDTLPLGFTRIGEPVVNGINFPSFVPSGNVLNFRGGTLAAGASATITIIGTAPNTTGTITNTAVIDPDNEIVEGNEGNNTATATTTINAGTAGTPDLSVIKLDNPDPVAAGGTLTYTILVNNVAGGATANDITVIDTLPGGFTVTNTTINGGGFTPNQVGDVLTLSGGDLNAGETATITITGTAPTTGPFPRTLFNQVIVDPANTIAESNEGNNSASTNTTLNAATTVTPDLTITKTDSPDPVAPSGTLTYTLTVSNTVRDSSASGIVVQDTLPTGLTNISASGDRGFTSSISGNVVTFSNGTLNGNESATLTITATAPSTTGTITNTAVVDPNDAIDETNENNNTATITTTVAATTPLADLSVTKSDNPDPVLQGGTLTYTLLVSNANNGVAASGIQVRDTLPDGFTVTNINIGSGGFTSSQTGNVITFSGGTLASGTSATITITGTAPTTGTFPRDIENTVVVDPNNVIAESNEANNTDTETTRVNSDSPDLTITKTDTPDPVLVGGTLNYTLTVKNEGAKDASGIVVRDTLPSGFTVTSAAGANGFSASTSGNIVTFSGGSLTAGQSTTLSIAGTVPNTPGVIINTAEVDPNNTIAESNETNNTATTTTTVTTSTSPGTPTPPGTPGTPTPPGTPPPPLPGLPPVFVPNAPAPSVEPPPSNPLLPIYLSTTNPNNFRGTEKPETIYGGPFDDTIDGAGGNDTLYGRDARDHLIGGNGSDNLFGNQGDDRLYGGDGDDTVYGGKDNDFINGERGHDSLRGDRGNDAVRGGDGDDTIYGGKENDSLIGDKGDDYLSGDVGNDTLDGVGNDRESVGEIDTLVGGEGSNLFILGTTNTVYYNNIGPGAGYGDYALIEDFNASSDRLQLKGGVNYLLNFSPNGLPGGTGIYIDDGSNVGVWDENDELIAVLKDIAPNNSLFSRVNFV